MSVSCSIYFLEQDKISCNTILDLKFDFANCTINIVWDIVLYIINHSKTAMFKLWRYHKKQSHQNACKTLRHLPQVIIHILVMVWRGCTHLRTNENYIWNYFSLYFSFVIFKWSGKFVQTSFVGAEYIYHRNVSTKLCWGA